MEHIRVKRNIAVHGDHVPAGTVLKVGDKISRADAENLVLIGRAFVYEVPKKEVAKKEVAKKVATKTAAKKVATKTAKKK